MQQPKYQFGQAVKVKCKTTYEDIELENEVIGYIVEIKIRSAVRGKEADGTVYEFYQYEYGLTKQFGSQWAVWTNEDIEVDQPPFIFVKENDITLATLKEAKNG